MTDPQIPAADSEQIPAADSEQIPAADSEQIPAAGSEPLGADGDLTVTVDDVMDALTNVIDPELGLDFVELGLVYGVAIDGGHVEVTFTLTTPACPIGPHVSEQMEEFVGDLEGVKSVDCQMVFTPPWSPERMSEDAKFALGY